MDWHEIEDKLKERAEEVARHLLPKGRREGAEWVCGDVDGSSGRSLKANLGGKAGIWEDFNGGNRKGNTFISLWCSVRGQPFKVCIVEAKEFLGIRDSDFQKRIQTYSQASGSPAEKPDDSAWKAVAEIWPKCQPLTPGGPVWKYLVHERFIEAQVLAWYDVREMISFGNWVMVFPYFAPAKDETKALTIIFDEPPSGSVRLPTWLKFERLDRPEGKKREWTTRAPEKCLFGLQLAVLEQFKDARHLLITEGEKDAMTWASYFGASQSWSVLPVSVPFGAKWRGQTEGQPSPNRAWIDRCSGWIDGFETVFVAMDSDEAGRRAAADIINEIGPRRCRLLELPEQAK